MTWIRLVLWREGWSVLPAIFGETCVVQCKQLPRHMQNLDLVILPNIQAVAKIDLLDEKRKERSRAVFYFKIYVMYVNNQKRVVRWRC